MKRVLAILGAAAAVIIGAVIFFGNQPTGPAAFAVDSDTIIVDVRTPAEYAGGHLEGAVLLDVSGGQLAAALPVLDPDAEYVVYCRSGNRSAQAAALMREAGYSNVTDLGSISQAASATGLPIVR